MSIHEPVEPDVLTRILDHPLLRDDPRFASGRIAALQYLTVGVFVFLLSGFWILQIRDPELYSERAERNRIKAYPLVAPRGKILDRDNRVIVDNHSSFSVMLSRENLKPEHVQPIASGLNLNFDDLAERLRRYDRTRPKYEPIIIKEELTTEELAFVESHRDPEFFPEMEVIHSTRRVYPSGQFAAHLIGYTGEISESELDLPEFAEHEPGAIIGKAGIEKQYNDILHGVDGQRRVVVDSRGRERQVMDNKDPTVGHNLQLTIDLDLQTVAELAMETRKGAVVALDPRNGEVLALVSRPAFEPSRFAVRIRSADWRDMVNDPERPLLNRAIQAQLAPGSTFKPLLAIAGLEAGVIDDGFTTYCPGGASFYGHYHKCWQKKGHGSAGLNRAIAQSCDVFFYTAGNRLGIDRLAYYGEMAGLGARTGIDLPDEKSGIMPSTRWKIRNLQAKWYPGETISVAIGQGYLTVTPLQLAHAIGGLVIGGAWHRPHLVKLEKQEKPRVWALQPENVRKVVDGMFAVVNPGGTGIRARIPGVEVCGKTGSAQLVSNKYVETNKGLSEHLKDNAWFVGFAPREKPEIVVAALYENAEHGYLAAPIVRDVIKSYFDKKARRTGAREEVPISTLLPVVPAPQQQ
ncbi:MAG: penicillin-binding protein 2 [Bryobacteraceae bacterium]